jgi:hypothetical protein
MKRIALVVFILLWGGACHAEEFDPVAFKQCMEKIICEAAQRTNEELKAQESRLIEQQRQDIEEIRKAVLIMMERNRSGRTDLFYQKKLETE